METERNDRERIEINIRDAISGRNIASYLQIIMQTTQCPIKSIDVLIRKLVKDTKWGLATKDYIIPQFEHLVITASAFYYIKSPNFF